jgi:Flagellar biosynthesis protein, FliO
MKTTRSSKPVPPKATTLSLPVLTDDAELTTLRSQTGLLSRLRQWLQARRLERSSDKRLRVAETVSLGEKRFVAVVQVDGRHFLLAGGPTNIALLAQLDPNEPFEDVLKKTMTVPTKQPAKRKRPAKRAGKPGARTAASANVPPMPQSNAPETFGDLFRKTITAAEKQPAKQASKQNGHSAVEQTGQYA